MKAKVLGGLLIGMLALAVTAAWGQGSVIAYDEAGNYTPATFVNGANEGFGFGVWDLWNVPADLGDSTAGGGGDLNSANGYSFRFMGDGAGNWCNGKREFDGALQTGDVLSFTFTYNWDGGGRGVDIFSASGQFANLIDVSPGNSFKVNGSEISTEWSPGAVVTVEITQLADGIQMHLTRAVDGTENLNYTTNILNSEPATGFSLYCGGYTSDPGDNVNYAIFMNDIQIVGEERRSLTFTSGTWDPQIPGDYEFTLTRTGEVGNDIDLASDNEAAATVPASVSFAEGVDTLVFTVTVVSVTSGSATIVASNEASGAWTDYVITPVAPMLEIDGEWMIYTLAPRAYTLRRVGEVGTNIVLTSSNTDVMMVPASVNFGAEQAETTFQGISVGLGTTTLTASNPASGVVATFDVTVSEPAIELTGPVWVWAGDTRTYTVTRFGPAGDMVNLSSSDTDVMTVPAQVEFPFGENVVTFEANALVTGSVILSAWTDDVPGGDTLAVDVTEMPGVLAHDEAGNYTPATFVHGANEGFGFAAWDLWNVPATLGDSTAGGGGDLNSTNGYSFRFMGDGVGGWSNARRNFDALQPGDVLSFTFTYNWDGGGRGVDIFSGDQEQFANLIDVSPGNTFRVNGNTISTEYSPGAVVEVEITQMADGIQLNLTRSVGGVPNLNYTTNILHGEASTGVSMYCGGYNSSPEDNNNYAIFMNDLMILGEERTSLQFTAGTWNPSQLGNYPFTLQRSGAVDDEIVLTSDNTASVTVPTSVSFAEGAPTVTFNVSVVSLTAGDATIVASNVASGAWAEYTIRPYESIYGPAIPVDLHMVGGDLVFSVPDGYTVGSIYGADCELVDGDWDWQPLVPDTDYTVDGGVVTIITDIRKIIRIGWVAE